MSTVAMEEVKDLYNKSKDAGAVYALRWELSKGLIRALEPVGDEYVLNDLGWEIHKFKPNEGYVGKAFVRMESIILEDVNNATDFIRTEFNCRSIDIRSIVWMPTEKKDALIEIGFSKALNQLPDVIAKKCAKGASVASTDADFAGVRLLSYEPLLMWTTGATIALRFEDNGTEIKAVGAWGKTDLLQALEWEKQAVKSNDEQSFVAQAIKRKKLLYIEDLEDETDESSRDYRRKEAMRKFGIHSIITVPQADEKGNYCLELGFDRVLGEIPDACRVGVHDDPEVKAEILEKLKKDPRTAEKMKKVLDEVKKIHDKNGYFPDPDCYKVQDVDQQTGDNWVPRNPWMNRLTGIHPFNTEAPVSLLHKHGMITPNTIHYVRDHGTVPRLQWQTHRITFDGNFTFPEGRKKTITMGELVKNFEPVTFACTLNCAGNRRKEQNMIQKGIGFNWGMCAASTAVWTGVPLSKVLEYMGIHSPENGGNFVNFFGPPDELPKGDGTYGASHSTEMCLNPTRHFMLAFMMNGELLHPDHGYPVRLLCPGYIGGRMIKWLSKITVTAEEGDNWYHINDNRVFPKHITSRDVADEEKIWQDPSYCIHDRNINSGFFAPTHCQKVKIVADKTFAVKGYAYAGGGRPVNRVEITLNGGRNWRPATLARLQEKADASAHTYGQRFGWVLWTVEVPSDKLANCGELCVRAWDDSQNSQPERPSWNLMGMMNNNWYRVKAHKIDGAVWFEHPTRVEPNLGHCWDLKNNSEVEIHTKANGELESPGWMERMKAEVVEVYKPIEKGEEKLDEKEGWEVDVQRWIKKK